MLLAGVALIVAPMVTLRQSTTPPAHTLAADPAQVLLSAKVTSPTTTSTVPLHRTVKTSPKHHVPSHRVTHSRVVAHDETTTTAAPITTTTIHVVAPVHHRKAPVRHRRAPVRHRKAPVHHRKAPVHRRVRPVPHRVGVATWYAWHPGQCATSYRPKGSRIWIRDLATGKVISCIVTDYQQPNPGRVVDLNETSFQELAPLWRGVVEVEVTW